MDLRIERKEDIYFLSGKIDFESSRLCIIYFGQKIESIEKQITIDINSIYEIDQKGLIALKTLFVFAKRHNKTLNIIGKGSKEIYDDIVELRVA